MATSSSVEQVNELINTVKLWDVDAAKKFAFKGGGRRDQLLAFQEEAQALWEKNKSFESEPNPGQEKFMCTFPYPYMNGVLHLGHAFTLSKAEFAAGYQRLKGKNVLFPFGFHCTGMPIQACAKKIAREMEVYGNPPVFPKEDEGEALEKDKHSGQTKKKQGKGSKKKLAKKKSKKKYQWEIMDEFGVPEAEKHLFKDPVHWLKYFPPIGVDHLKQFGLKADFRRSFITTDINPYYDAFIQWQFRKLKERDYIAFGKRPSVFAPCDKQPCADHDRAEGEGAKAQEYTLIKMELIFEEHYTKDVKGDNLEFLKDRKVFLVAGTLRPETMYGQTNCFVLPNGDYIAIEMKNGEVFICNENSARNMSWQGMTPEEGKFTVLAQFKGWDLLGRPLKAPNAQYPRVYVFPLLSIKMDKATGIVTSVPSDAPDDYAALMDMKKNAKFRKKYHITDEMVEGYDVVEIIEIPELGRRAAADLCIQMKVKDQNDSKKLAVIKDQVYTAGFYKGKMIIGPYAGSRVEDAKDKIKQEMIDAGLAAVYWEPDAKVVSRTGDVCVVAFVDQWYLKYGLEEWRDPILKHLNSTMDCFNKVAKDKFNIILNWLGEWACSRSFGLGTYVPWDKQFVIESLSDSTIYMAYYTIAHILQGPATGATNLDGTGSSFPADALTDEVFDFIFLKAPMPKDSKIPAETLQKMQDSFEYYYPMDLRVSGKDLIGNHLTMALYNHAAIWKDPAKWPRTYYTNGHAMINAEKMSKSTGNFMTLTEACKRFSADATRYALADAGDGLEDANFDEKTADTAILKLTKEQNFIEEFLKNKDSYRTGSTDNFLDRVFDNSINEAIAEADEGYARMKYRRALRAFIVLQNSRNFYYLYGQKTGLHRDLIQRYIETEIILIAPICPHWAECMWARLGKKGLACDASWPEAAPKNVELAEQLKYIEKNAHNIRVMLNKNEAQRKKKSKKAGKELPAPDSVNLFITDDYTQWQQDTLVALQTLYAACEDKDSFAQTFRNDLMKTAPVAGKYKNKREKSNVMQFSMWIVRQMEERGEVVLQLKTPFDEYELATKHKAMLTHDLGIANVNIWRTGDPAAPTDTLGKQLNEAKPGNVLAYFYNSGAAGES